ncbi:hypothetical protein ACQJBY_006652 [Aegilops geniculata]
MADSAINVVSLRIVKAGPDYTYPVEVYGRVIVRDEVDYKCVHLFDREKNNAQLINSEEDMLALTGPCRALVTDDLLFFEFDLKIKGKGEHDSEVQFSKGVILYHLDQYHKRFTRQLPSFQSTVKLVLQHVANPVAASVEVHVLDKQPGVDFNAKITVGTTRNYRQHMIVYDSSLPSSHLIRQDGSLVLNRNLVAVQEPSEDPAFKDDEQMVVYVCFLDAGCEIEDEDYAEPVFEDADYIRAGGDDEISEEDSEGETEEDEDEEDGSVDPKNLVTLRYPLRETVCEFGSCKLKVKVKWTAILDAPPHGEYVTRFGVLPDGYKSPNYRQGSFFDR